MSRKDGLQLDPGVVEQARHERLLTRAELAERAGLSGFTIWSAFNGRRIGLLSARKIARALGVSLKSLLAESNDQHNESGMKPVEGWGGAMGGVSNGVVSETTNQDNAENQRA